MKQIYFLTTILFLVLSPLKAQTTKIYYFDQSMSGPFNLNEFVIKIDTKGKIPANSTVLLTFQMFLNYSNNVNDVVWLKGMGADGPLLNFQMDDWVPREYESITDISEYAVGHDFLTEDMLYSGNPNDRYEKKAFPDGRNVSFWQVFLTVTEGTGTLSNDTIEKDASIRVFPNPSSDYIQVTGLSQPEKYTVYTMLGTEVKSGLVAEGEKINIQSLANGIYFMKLNNGQTLKFVKQ